MSDSSTVIRRPLAAISLVYAAGILCGGWIAGPDWHWAGWAALVGATIWLILRLARYSRLAGLTGLLALFLVGWAMISLRMDNAAPDHLANLITNPRETLELRGHVAGNPDRMPGYSGKNDYWSFEFDVSAIRRLPDWQPVRGRVKARMTANPGVQPRAGAQWELFGVLTDNLRRNSQMLSHKFVLENINGQLVSQPLVSRVPAAGPRLRLDGRFYFRANAAHSKCIKPGLAWHPAQLLDVCRKHAGALLRRGLKDFPDEAAILRALALGYRAELPEAIRRSFTATGTFHLFAISGLHMALLAGFVVGILRMAGICRIYWFAVAAPVLVAFTCMVGAPASAVRGSLMAGLWLLGPMVSRRPDGWSAWAAAGLLILAVSPELIFSPGFILSFVTVAGLLGWNPFFTVRPDAHSDDSGGLKDGSRPLPWFVNFWHYLRFLGMTSLTAWLASMPLIAYWFNTWSPYTPLANIPVIPLAAVMLGLSFFAIAAGMIHSGLAVIFNLINIIPVKLALWWLGFVEELPYCRIFVRSPGIWELTAWYVGLGIMFSLKFRSTGMPENERNSGWFDKFKRIRVCLALGLMLVWPVRQVLELGVGRMDLLNAGGVPVAAGRVPDYGGTWLLNVGSRRYTRRVQDMMARAGMNAPDIWFFNGLSAKYVAGGLNLSDWLNSIPARVAVFPAETGRYRLFAELSDKLRQSGVVLKPVRGELSEDIPAGLDWVSRAVDDARTMDIDLGWPDWKIASVFHNDAISIELLPRRKNDLEILDMDEWPDRERQNNTLLVNFPTHSFGVGNDDPADSLTVNLSPWRIMNVVFDESKIILRWTDPVH